MHAVVGGESVEDMLRIKDGAIYSLKQEIASLREERDATIYEIKELRAENELLRSQLPLTPIEEEGAAEVVHPQSFTDIFYTNMQVHLLLFQSRQRSRKKLSQ